MRPRRRTGSVACLLACTALVAACGGTVERGTGPTTAAPPATSTSTTVTATTVTGTTATGTTVTGTTVTPTTPTTTSLPTSTTPSPPAFRWTSSALDPATRALLAGRTWHPGCPVSLDDLRLVELTYWGFDSSAHTGQLVVEAGSVSAVVAVFRSLYGAKFPIRQMRLVDYYGGDDEKSMAADNTSAFNCRLVPGTSTWSQHALGRSVDINPLENPELQGGLVDPPSASPWADRSRTDPGMVRHGDAAWRAFAAVGWKWGGDWVSLKDYMHFSANGL